MITKMFSLIDFIVCDFCLSCIVNWKYSNLLIIFIRDPIPVPEKQRKPLTEVQEFNLHVDHRAVDRAEFDKKVTFPPPCTSFLSFFFFFNTILIKEVPFYQIKEKEVVYKRYREEAESARMVSTYNTSYVCNLFPQVISRTRLGRCFLYLFYCRWRKRRL